VISSAAEQRISEVFKNIQCNRTYIEYAVGLLSSSEWTELQALSFEIARRAKYGQFRIK